MKKRIIWLLLVVALSGLGCQRSRVWVEKGNILESSQSLYVKNFPKNYAKWSAYIEAYNFLEGERFQQSNAATLEWRRARDNKKVQKGDFTKILPSGDAEKDVERLERALRAAGTLATLDTIALELSQSIRQALPNWQALEHYNREQTYRQDKGRQGKKHLAIYVIDQKRIAQGYEQFRKAFEAEKKQQTEQLIQTFAQSEQMLLRYSHLAFDKADDMIDLFSKNPPHAWREVRLLQQAQELLQELHKDMVLLSMALQHQKDERAMCYASAFRSLEHFIQGYKAVLDSPTSWKINQMINDYNAAVDAYNSLAEY